MSWVFSILIFLVTILVLFIAFSLIVGLYNYIEDKYPRLYRLINKITGWLLPILMVLYVIYSIHNGIFK